MVKEPSTMGLRYQICVLQADFGENSSADEVRAGIQNT